MCYKNSFYFNHTRSGTEEDSPSELHADAGLGVDSRIKKCSISKSVHIELNYTLMIYEK
jgi:hypothetical protein